MLIYQVNIQKSYTQNKIRPKETKKYMNIKLNSFEAYTYDDQSIRHMPKDFLRYSNLRKSRVLVRISSS